MVVQNREESVDVGHALAALHVRLTAEQVRCYALAARMPGGRFMSDEAARKEGLPGQIVPGNMSIALFARVIAAAWPTAELLQLHATFRGLVRPEVPLVVHGVVTETHRDAHGDRIECDLVLEGAEGDRWVTGTASIRLPARN